MSIALAVKYRPKTWEDVSEQTEVVDILTNQIKSDEIKHGYLFTGPAGCGKTTSARIFANEINHGQGKPIELDAASNNSVDDIRRLIEDSQTQSIDSEYKVFIIDECHMITPQGWNAFLKTLEEPPAKSIFIMATTNPEKIPQTILSRVQRYNFKKISKQGIVDRLCVILTYEVDTVTDITTGPGALDYIARLADGGMRDAITLMDKCLSYSHDLTIENISHALGLADYTVMQNLTDAVKEKDRNAVIDIIQDVYNSGADLKLFIRQYFEFVLNLALFVTTRDISVTTLPSDMTGIKHDYEFLKQLVDFTCNLNYALKYEQNPRVVILAKFLTEVL